MLSLRKPGCDETGGINSWDNTARSARRSGTLSWAMIKRNRFVQNQQAHCANRTQFLLPAKSTPPLRTDRRGVTGGRNCTRHSRQKALGETAAVLECLYKISAFQHRDRHYSGL